MKNRIIFLLSCFLILSSCKKKNSRVVDSPQQGFITLTADESFQSVAEALSNRYMALYPGTTIDLKIQKEDFGLSDLIDGKVRVAVMSRQLSDYEKEAYRQKVDLDLVISNFAADAVLFVVPKDAARSEISIEKLKQELTSGDKNMIFDGTNSSNLNFIAQKINREPQDLEFSIISGNKNLLAKLNAFPKKVGVVSLNTFSRPYDPESVQLRESVKILKVTDGAKTFTPELQNLANGQYPFTRMLYFISNEKYFGLGSGFIRFSCTQLGQIVVAKEGLQPYNIFRREVQMR